jgi:hypothetical protein
LLIIDAGWSFNKLLITHAGRDFYHHIFLLNFIFITNIGLLIIDASWSFNKLLITHAGRAFSCILHESTPHPTVFQRPRGTFFGRTFSFLTFISLSK